MKRGGNTVFSWCRRIVCFSADGGASHPLPLAECLGEAVVTAFDYDNDAIGRRTARLDALPGDVAITNAFGYNMRSEVTQANMGINIYGYVFDPIGNRITATNNAEVTSYVANELNQYTNILCASAPLRDPSYDSDGNMTTTGDGWHYVWNGENRLVIASNAIHVVSYAYDHRGRMVRKNIAPSNASPSETIRYLWDDFNIIAETVASDSATNTTYNVWGLDLDGMLQGAGGVGGLLAVVKDTAIYIPAWDANGNIMEYVAEDGSIVAHREYDPFGETVVQSGALADTFAFRFSTKYWENEANLYYYGYRFYSPELGRWLSRDPIGEAFQRHLYGFVKNNGVRYVDLLGLLTIYIGGAGERTLGMLEKLHAESGCDEAFDNKQHAEIEERIRKSVEANPCEPVILVGHSYGGDTAMDVAAKLQNVKCLCLYVITLDPVSHFDPDTWFWQNPATPNITEWINVYQSAGAVDYIAAVPVVGWAIGGIWSAVGGIGNLVGLNIGNNMIATGGGQWNNISGPDYRIKADGIDHHDVSGMMNLEFEDPSGRKISVRDYMNELQGRSCCE